MLQQATITPYSAPLLILDVKNTHHLHFIYTSKAPQAGGGLPTSIKYFSLSLFVFFRTAAGLTRPLFSYQQCTKFTLNIFKCTHSLTAQLTRRASDTFQWQQQQWHVTFCQDIYIIPMVPHCSLLDAPPAVGSIYLTSAQVEMEFQWHSDFNV